MSSRRVVSILGQVVAVGAAVALAGLLVVPKLIGWQVLTVLTGSMSPEYPAGGIVAIERVDVANVKVGDVIAFRPTADAVPITHRVIEVSSDPAGRRAFLTKGDANEEADPRPVSAANVQGRVVFGVPYVGYAVNVIRSKVGFGLLVLVPGLALGASQLRQFRRALKGEGSAEKPTTLLTEPVVSPLPVDGRRVGLQLLVVTVAVRDGASRDVADLVALYSGQLLEGTGDWYTVAFVAGPQRIVEIERHLLRLDVVAIDRSPFVAVAALAERAVSSVQPPVRNALVVDDDDLFIDLLAAPTSSVSSMQSA